MLFLEFSFGGVEANLHNLGFQFSFFHHLSYRNLHETYSSSVQSQAKHRYSQLNFKVDDIHKYTTSQSTQLFGIAISQPWVYNLMCMPLLTVLHFKREMQSCLDMCWMVLIKICKGWWDTSANCYSFLGFPMIDSSAPTSKDIGNSQWFSRLGSWTHLWSSLAHEGLLQRHFVIMSYLSQVCT